MVLIVSYVFVVLTILSMDLMISQATSRITFQESSIANYHQQWMIQFSRVYSDESEKQLRFEVFKKNLKFIENFNNNGNHTYKLGVNEFTDWTKEEFLATHTGLSGINVTSHSEVVDETMPSLNWNVRNVVSESKDWTKEGAVTPVKSQGECAQSGGISSELAYPYNQVTKGSCRSKNKPVMMQIRGFKNVASNDERALLEAVSRQPVSVCIAASADSFIHYAGGLYNAPDCGIYVIHAVTLVGYGTSPEGIKYWLAKNSWGQTWGENGYIRLRRDVEWPQGMCGIAQFASYPVV
ncbi:unnamed protein product [Thlaspi arvense]|uniref:Uncharacterized protein n=1 Tax=Thlaspi arvense TaxID=13288 RepID=A0AAU9SWF9_THLAR|nr:unnamed protein product [Thlaspi arvense]